VSRPQALPREPARADSSASISHSRPALVSVVIPVYNRADTVAAAVQSALDQEYSPIEIIVVDDGSTHETAEVVARFGDRVRYLRREHGGQALARNQGIRAARGEFVAFLDDDDLWVPGKLDAQMRVFEARPELALVYGRYSGFGEEAERDGEIHFEVSPSPLGLFRRNFIGTLTVVVRKSCLESVGMFRQGIQGVEDYDLWLRIAAEYELGMVDEIVARYRYHAGNFSGRRRTIAEGELCALLNARDLYARAGIDLPRSVVRRRLNRVVARLGRAHAQEGSTREARRCFGRALRLAPFRRKVWREYFDALRRELRERRRASDLLRRARS
jgi:glycosyltransferase involved in cell wall biosynthesis